MLGQVWEPRSIASYSVYAEGVPGVGTGSQVIVSLSFIYQAFTEARLWIRYCV